MLGSVSKLPMMPVVCSHFHIYINQSLQALKRHTDRLTPSLQVVTVLIEIVNLAL